MRREPKWSENAWMHRRALKSIVHGHGHNGFCVFGVVQYLFFLSVSGDMRSVSSIKTKKAAAKQWWGWILFVGVTQINIFHSRGVINVMILVPVPASSSCGRRREGTQQWHPTACCGPETAGFLCKGPMERNWVLLHGKKPAALEVWFFFKFYLNVFG